MLISSPPMLLHNMYLYDHVVFLKLLTDMIIPLDILFLKS